MALVALLQNNKQGETEMSEPKEIEKEKSFFAMCKDFFSNSSEATAEPVAEEEKDVQAMDEEEIEDKEKEAVAMDEEMEEEEAKAESDSEAIIAEKDAKIAELKEQLQNKLDKEIEAEKTELIFSAMASSKLTHAQGKDFFAMDIESVKAELESKPTNDTGLAKGAQPEAVQNYYEQYKAIKDNAERSAFYHKYTNEINKDKNK